MNPISAALAKWYHAHHRQLPWRETSDPYSIWVSEVILQQTRVDQGLKYYRSFIEKWPDVQALAAAGEDEVLKMWQGLGYYSRARNLQFGARQVVDKYGGVVPSDFDKLLKIKGIGRYTAAAIASIAFNEPVAVVDGNVSRVVSRLFAVEKPVNTASGEAMVRLAADALLDLHNPGLHNQAMMEFGALVCLQRSPRCNECVVNDHCQALKAGLQNTLPAKKPKTAYRSRWFNYFVVTVQLPDGKEEFLIGKREDNDIWKGLYQFPLYESHGELPLSELHDLARSKFGFLGDIHPGRSVKARPHQLTHQRIHATFFELIIQPSFDINLPNGLSLAGKDQLHQIPFPRLIEIFLNESLFVNN